MNAPGGIVRGPRPVIIDPDETFIRARWIMHQLRAGHTLSRHHDCLHFIADLERDIYGEVMSESVKDHVAGCRYDPYLIGA
jgi:hypothetical protein